MTKAITAGHCPGLGDIRAMGAGDTVWVQPDARERKDGGRGSWQRLQMPSAVGLGCSGECAE